MMNSKTNARIIVVAVAFFAFVAGAKAIDYANAIDQGNNAADKQKFEMALEFYNEAIRLEPNQAKAYSARAYVYIAKDELDKAIADCNKALELDSDDIDAFSYRGDAHYFKQEFDKAIEDYENSIRLFPDDPLAYAYMSFALMKKEDFEKAIEASTKAVDLSDESLNTILKESYGNFKKRRFLDAAEFFVYAFMWHGECAETRTIRGYIYFEFGEYDKAFADCKKALEMNPGSVESQMLLAWAQATCPDVKFRNGTEAVKHAKKACELGGETIWECLDTLAAAYAECGDFDKAREVQEKVVKMIADRNIIGMGHQIDLKKDKEECRTRLELYKQNKPYREEPIKK